MFNSQQTSKQSTVLNSTLLYYSMTKKSVSSTVLVENCFPGFHHMRFPAKIKVFTEVTAEQDRTRECSMVQWQKAEIQSLLKTSSTSSLSKFSCASPHRLFKIKINLHNPLNFFLVYVNTKFHSQFLLPFKPGEFCFSLFFLHCLGF